MIEDATSSRWHAISYLIVAIVLVLLAYETLGTQTVSGAGIEFTVGSGYAHLVNSTDTPILAHVKSHAPFIVESEDNTLRYDVSSKIQETNGIYEREIQIPSGEFNFRLVLGSNVTFQVSYEAQVTATVVPYDSGDSLMMLAATALSVVGSLYFAVRSLRASTNRQGRDDGATGAVPTAHCGDDSGDPRPHSFG